MGVVPLFTEAVRVIRLPKAADVGVATSVVVLAAWAAPPPVTMKVCGLPDALSATLIVAESAPVFVGAKATSMSQEPPTATAPQLPPTMGNSVGSLDVTEVT